MTHFGPEPRVQEIWKLLRARSNWDRWGPDDQVGAVNLITGEKRRAAAGLVTEGRSISLARPYPKVPSSANRHPAQHMVMSEVPRRTGGMVMDYYGIAYHGLASTHIDALCHVWDQDGMWGGRLPIDVLGHDGVRWADIEQWSNGIITRGVLLDVPKFRGTDFVDSENPVHGSELAAIAAAGGIEIEPGDALVVYSGREAWSRARGEWGSDEVGPDGEEGSLRPGLVEGIDRPGLHASCLEFISDSDCSMLVWDMMDATPIGYPDLAWAVHAAIWSFGVALVDNALLEPLSDACRESGRHEFMLTVAPLRVDGGTGSPVNPIALL